MKSQVKRLGKVEEAQDFSLGFWGYFSSSLTACVNRKIDVGQVVWRGPWFGVSVDFGFSDLCFGCRGEGALNMLDSTSQAQRGRRLRMCRQRLQSLADLNPYCSSERVDW